MTGCWFEFLQEKGLMNCKINNHQGCHLDDHYKWNYHYHDMQLEWLNSVAKFMKEGFSDNNSVILTAIKYSCNPDNYLIYTHLCINRNHIDHFELLNSVNSVKVFKNLNDLWNSVTAAGAFLVTFLNSWWSDVKSEHFSIIDSVNGLVRKTLCYTYLQ